MSKENHTTLVHRYPDKVIPEDYLRRLIKERPSAGGYAVQTMENGNPSLVTDHNDVGADLEGLQLFLKGYDKSHILMAFHKFAKVLDADIQPYDYVVDGDIVDLAFGVEGSFPLSAESGITEETNLSKRVIIPNLNKFRKFAAGDLEAFMKELRDPTFIDMMMARIGDRGTFCFFPPIGDPVMFGKNKLGSSYPWGQVSNTHDYVEVPATVSESQVVKVGWFTKKKGPDLPVNTGEPVKVPAQPDPPIEPGKTPDTKIDAPPAPPGSTPQQPEGTVVDLGNGLKGTWKTVPMNMSNNDRKHMVKRVTQCGNNMPPNWKDPGFTYLEIDYGSNPKTLEALRDKLVADAGTKLAPAPTRGSEVVHEANVMILTAEEKSAAESGLLKMMDRQGKEIPTPLELQKMETKYPKFASQFGMEVSRINGALPEDIKVFAMENGKAFFHLYLETRGLLREAEAKLAAGTTKAVETHALAKEELQPEKKTGTGGWGNWKK